MHTTGQCRCGRVTFEVSAPPMLTMACHCRGCQQMTSSAFSLSAAIPTEGFRLTKGEPVIGGLHGEIQHYFCDYCMSWMFSRFPGMDYFVNVRATLLDDPALARPFVETFTSEKLDWVRTPARHSYAGFPPEDAYPALTAEYAALRASAG